MDSKEIRKRQQRRKLEKQKRLEQQKKLQKRLMIGVFGAVVLIILCLCIVLLAGNSSGDDTPTSSNGSVGAMTSPTEAETVIHLAFGGDVNVTNKVIEAGYTPNGYDYSKIFRDILPTLADADNTVVNFEGSLCGPPYGSKDTRAPQELAEALSHAGVDMLQMANSYSINNGMIGLEQTLSNIRTAGMEPLGAYGTAEEAQSSGGYTLRNIRGVKVAFVAFTKGMDSMSLPEGKERCVNVLYKDYTSSYQTVDTEGITEVLESVEASEPDVTIALLHWGSEYNNQISSSQKRIVNLMKQNGVDAIIGTHSHYVQEIDYDEKTGSLVAYSLGDLLGDADRSRTAYSIVLNLQVTKDNKTGDTRITGYDYTPIYIENQEDEEGDLTTRLLRIPQAIEEYEAKGISMVSEETYNAMTSAMTRLEKLFAPKEEES